MENNQPNNESRVQLEKVKQDEAFFESETVLQETSDADAQIITLPGKTPARENAQRHNAIRKNSRTVFDQPNRPSNRVRGLVNADEIARILSVPKTWVYERTRQGQKAIPFIRLGAYVRFEPEEVINFFKSKEN